MKAALIGYGYWGRIIQKYLLENQEIELVGICSPHYEGSVSLEVLFDIPIDIAFVCTPISTHYNIVKQLLLKRINVFCEKPLCKSFEETKELIKIAKNNEIVLFTDYIYTYSPSIMLIKNKLYKYGKIHSIDMELSQFGNFYKNDNVFEVIGVHLFSVLSFLFSNDNIEIEKVFPMEKDIEGNTLAGIIIYSIRRTIFGSMKCSLIGNKKVRKISLVCDTGLICFDMLSENTVSFIEYEKNNHMYTVVNKENYAFDENNNLNFVITDFINCVHERKQNDDNLRITEEVSFLLQRCYE